jgi:hypothetical protein
MKETQIQTEIKYEVIGNRRVNERRIKRRKRTEERLAKQKYLFTSNRGAGIAQSV